MRGRGAAQTGPGSADDGHRSGNALGCAIAAHTNGRVQTLGVQAPEGELLTRFCRFIPFSPMAVAGSMETLDAWGSTVRNGSTSRST